MRIKEKQEEKEIKQMNNQHDEKMLEMKDKGNKEITEIKQQHEEKM